MLIFFAAMCYQKIYGVAAYSRRPAVWPCKAARALQRSPKYSYIELRCARAACKYRSSFQGHPNKQLEDSNNAIN